MRDWTTEMRRKDGKKYSQRKVICEQIEAAGGIVQFITLLPDRDISFSDLRKWVADRRMGSLYNKSRSSYCVTYYSYI
jgi:hypothetical protein